MVESSFTITAGKLALAIWRECYGRSIGNQGAGLSSRFAHFEEG